MRHSLSSVLLKSAPSAIASLFLLACSAAAPVDGSSTTASLSVGECEPAADGTAGAVMSIADANDACGARGLLLNQSRDDDGMYKCCKAAPTPVDAGAGSGTCSVQSVGRNDSCADSASWKDDATKTCELEGATLATMHLTDSCGAGLYRYAKITCCAVDEDGGVAPPPGDDDGGPGFTDGGVGTDDGGISPPGDDDGGFTTEDGGPPVACQYYAIGEINGVCNSTSKDLASAKAQCASLDLTLEDYTTTKGACGKGKEAQANYACCGAGAVTMSNGGSGEVMAVP